MSNYQQLAERTISWLCDRKGFDDWWDGIDGETKTEIEHELGVKLQEWQQGGPR